MPKSRPMRPSIKAPKTPAATVAIAYIHPGMVSAFFTSSMLAMLLHDQNTSRHITGLSQEWSSANVSASRNTLTSRFLDNGDQEWLLWIDSDMSWEHDALDRLLAVADPVKAPIVGGLCFGASEGELFPTIYQFAQREDGTPVTIRPPDFPPDTMIQVAATGAAFLLIHRGALEAIRARAFNATFPFFQETEMGGLPVGEDLTFCIRAGIVGLPVWVHTGIYVGHHKSHLLTNDLFREQLAAKAGNE